MSGPFGLDGLRSLEHRPVGRSDAHFPALRGNELPTNLSVLRRKTGSDLTVIANIAAVIAALGPLDWRTVHATVAIGNVRWTITPQEAVSQHAAFEEGVELVLHKLRQGFVEHERARYARIVPACNIKG